MSADLLTMIVGMGLGEVYNTVLLNAWNNNFITRCRRSISPLIGKRPCKLLAV